MKIINASAKILYAFDDVLSRIETIGRTCYKSEEAISPGSDSKFVREIMSRRHYPLLDHVSASVRFIVDRGVSHELVRHRIAAHAQESTRYCNYSKERFGRELTFVYPFFLINRDSRAWHVWLETMERAENAYLEMLDSGCKAEEARSVLPNSLKTEIVTTMPFTSWRHVFKLRCAKEAHPQMREVMIPLLHTFAQRWPEVFGDIEFDREFAHSASRRT